MQRFNAVQKPESTQRYHFAIKDNIFNSDRNGIYIYQCIIHIASVNMNVNLCNFRDISKQEEKLILRHISSH